MAAVVAAGVLAAHWTALDAKALCIDDTEYLVENPLVQKPSWDSARRFLTEVSDPSSVKGYYQPLNMISLMLDCAMGGGARDLRVFHRTSLLLHAANAVLVMALLHSLFGNAWAAGAAALLFGVHPMTVETIPWIGERKTLLAAFFALVSLLFYVRHARGGGPKGSSSARNRGWGPWLALSAGAYVLAVLSKPTAMPLPFVMVLMDFWPLRRLGKKALLEKVPFLAVAAASSAITYISQSKLAAVSRPAWQAGLVLCHNIVFYPWKMLWPAGLTPHYEYPRPLEISHPAVLAGVLGTALLVAALLVWLRRTRAPATGWAIFLVAIFPTMGVIGFSNVIASDKYAYLPVVGLLMVLAHYLSRLWDWRPAAAAPAGQARPSGPPRLPRRTRWPRIALVAAVGALAFAEAVGTRRYLAAWRDTISLYRHMLAYAPDSGMIHNNLGRFVELRGNDLLRQAAEDASAGRLAAARSAAEEAHQCLREARRHFEEAVRLYEGAGQAGSPVADALVNLGKAVFMDAKRELDAARRQAATEPSKVPQAQQAAQRLEAAARQAEEMFRGALTVAGEKDYAAMTNLGAIAFGYRGDANEGIGWFQKALEIHPYYASARLNLGLALEKRGGAGDLAEAWRNLLLARACAPSDPSIAEALREFQVRHPEFRGAASR